MTDRMWDGHDLLSAVRHAASLLGAHAEEVNALNVFPVPDGDTGSNMLATVQAAVEEADELAVGERSVPAVGAALSFGALMGARGNSGVILSQLFRGMSEVVTGLDRVSGVDLARAFERGCQQAFAAVAHPVEGTILTVARDVAAAAEPIARKGGSLEAVLSAAVDGAIAAVERTPQLLPILEHAGVVDAGGKGLEFLLRGALAFARGEDVIGVAAGTQDIVLPHLDAVEADGFGYETVFVITPHAGTELNSVEIRRRLDDLGESVLVAGDQRAVKIHVHNERPDEVIAYGLSLGTLSRIGVENLDRLAQGVREHAEPSSVGPIPDAQPETTADGVHVVAVVSGDGLARVFRTLGARAVVLGGQSANPSAGEIAEAIEDLGASEVIVLPNNRNVRMAARQAGELTNGTKVEVVPTRNAAEGIAAMLALSPDASARESARRMAAAAKRIQSFQVTAAVRDARMGRHRVKRDEFIVLNADDRLVASDLDRTAAVVSAVKKLKPGFELLTIYRGEGVSHAAALRLRDSLGDAAGEAEIEVIDGGQPHYDFLIAAE